MKKRKGLVRNFVFITLFGYNVDKLKKWKYSRKKGKVKTRWHTWVRVSKSNQIFTNWKRENNKPDLNLFVPANVIGALHNAHGPKSKDANLLWEISKYHQRWSKYHAVREAPFISVFFHIWAYWACPNGLEHFSSMSTWAISCFRKARMIAW